MCIVAKQRFFRLKEVVALASTVREAVVTIPVSERRDAWPVYWSAVWVGALSALALALIIGLIAVAVGAHELNPARRVVTMHDVTIGALVFSVVGAFFAFVLGGWVAATIAGLRRAEPAMLHGAIVWLLVVPMLLVLAALGAGNYFGAWFGGLAGTPAWVTPTAAAADPQAAQAARTGALGAVAALLIGLVGSVIGGWMASGEPMTLAHYRARDQRPRAVAAAPARPRVR